jgi:amidase
MAMTIDDVILFSKAFAEQAPWKYGAECVPFPWQNVEPKAHLKLAVVWDDGVVAPTPPVRRALEDTLSRPKNAGHDIVDFPLSADEMQEAMRIAFGLVYADGGNWVHKVIDHTGEPMSPEMAIFGQGKPKKIFELHEHHVLRDVLRMKWLEKWNSIDELDGILSKMHPLLSFLIQY